MYTQRHDMLGSASNATTSNPVLTADYRDMSLSIQTSTGSASNITVQGSNADGLTSAIAEASWSNLTVIPASGVQTVDPSIRWMRVIRDTIAVSAASNTTVTLQGKALS